MTRVAIWATGQQHTLIERALNAEGPGEPLTLAVVGAADAQAAEALASRFKVPAVTEVRGVLHAEVDVIWLAAPGVLDADGRSLVRTASVPVATSAPPPAELADLLAESDGGMPALFLPLMRGGAAFQSASTALESFGEIHCVHVSATAGDHQTSNSALALDAFDLVAHLLGEPDELWAAHAGPLPITPDPVVDRPGHLTAAMRFGRERAASITVSDGGGSWIRRVVILGEGGRLIVTDEGVSWTDPEGRSQEAPPTEGQSNAGELAGWHLRRMAEGRPLTQVSIDAAILQEAARLSCLTRQVEDPDRVRRMVAPR